MKKTAILGLGIAFSLALAGTSQARHATTAAGWAANGIVSSRHNLSTSGSHINMRTVTTGNNPTAAVRATIVTGTSEMCAICHTPHFTDRSAGPLWNRINAVTSVSGYGTTIAKNIDATQSNAGSMFSTLACLSCHDGVTTFGALINKPGAGGLTDGYAAGTKGWQFKDKDDAGNITSESLGEGRLIIGAGGAVDRTSGGVTAGGADLANDHPIGVLYRGQGEADASASLRAKSVIISSISMNVAKGDRGVQSGTTEFEALVTGNLWAVKGFISKTATIQDLLKSGSGQGSGNYVQCASCHDLHYKNQTNPEAWFVSTYSNATVSVTNHEDGDIDGLFLRRVGGNSDSGLCRTCHDKQ